MRTQLPKKISSEQEAKDFLKALHENGEMYHADDDAHDIMWGMGINVSVRDADKLNKLMDQVHTHLLDPCAYQCELLGHEIE